MLKQIETMTEDEKKKFVVTVGKTMLYIAEGRSLFDMSNELNLQPWQVDHNIDEMLYDLRKSL